MITIRGAIAAADYAEAMQLQLRPRPAFVALGALLLCVILLALYQSFREFLSGDGSWVGMALVVWFVMCFPYGYFVLIPHRARKIYAQQRSMREPFESVVDESGFRSTSAYYSGCTDWSYFRKWAEGKNVFVLFQSDAILNIIPKRLFVDAEGASEFRSLLARHLPRAANNSFKPPASA